MKDFARGGREKIHSWNVRQRPTLDDSANVQLTTATGNATTLHSMINVKESTKKPSSLQNDIKPLD